MTDIIGIQWKYIEITDDPQSHKAGAERAAQTLKKVRAELDEEIEFLEIQFAPKTKKIEEYPINA